MNQSEERLVGTFVTETGEVHLVENEENGYLHGTLLDPQRPRIMLVRPGEKPVASSHIRAKMED